MFADYTWLTDLVKTGKAVDNVYEDYRRSNKPDYVAPASNTSIINGVSNVTLAIGVSAFAILLIVLNKE
jgi:hypothetical protein